MEPKRFDAVHWRSGVGLPRSLLVLIIRTNVRMDPQGNIAAPVTVAPPVQSSTHLSDTRFDRRLSQIIDYATEVFAEKGYEGASMRDLSRMSGISLAGLYYYFESKEKLLYFIQKHTFVTIVDRLGQRLALASDAELRIRLFVQNHVDYAISHPAAMKVLSHEDDVLTNSYGGEVTAIKREYYRICHSLVDDLVRYEGLKSVKEDVGPPGAITTRTAVMALFGMMNWLNTWYNPRVDPNADSIARQFSDILLQGVRGEKAKAHERLHKNKDTNGKEGVRSHSAGKVRPRIDE